MENVEMGNEGNCTKTPGTNGSSGQGRPPPIIPTSEANLINLQRQIKSVVRGEFFFFRNTANGTRITTKSMVDYNAIQKFLNEKNLHFFTFYTKADKPVNTITRQLPGNNPAENIIVALQQTDYHVVSVKQMTAKRTIPEGGVTHTYLPLFLVILARN
jgi:hypothetical protein